MQDWHSWWPLPPRAALAAGSALAVLAIAVMAFVAIAHKHSPAPLVAQHAPRKTSRIVAVFKPSAPKAAPGARLAPKPTAPSAFDLEQQMTFAQLMKRWDPLIADASKRFNVSENWIRAVMHIESGGRTMLDEKTPIISSAGAMGLMQLMPPTYHDMRLQYRLGKNPYDPHDNILAGAAYLALLRDKYGYPAMFAAYNDGPGNLDERMRLGGLLPLETQNYLAVVTGTAMTGGGRKMMVKFTRPDGSPVMINAAGVFSVRAAFPGEYAPGVQSVLTSGRMHQGVRESLAQARSIIRTHGGGI